MDFNFQPVLSSNLWLLRPLIKEDAEALYQAASAAEIWADHPAKNRYQRAVFMPYFDFLFQTGSTLVFIDKDHNRMAGCSRFYVTPHTDALSIGFTFIHHDYWGGTANFQIKALMLEHAFAYTDKVWFHIDPNNIRSQKATAKLGAVYKCDESLDLGTGLADYQSFQLDRAVWEHTLADKS